MVAADSAVPGSQGTYRVLAYGSAYETVLYNFLANVSTATRQRPAELTCSRQRDCAAHARAGRWPQLSGTAECIMGACVAVNAEYHEAVTPLVRRINESSSAWRNRSTGAFSLVEASVLYGLDAAAAAAVRAGRRGTPELMSPSEALQALDPLYAEATWAGAAPAGPIGTTIWLEDGAGASVAILFTGLACFVASAYFVREAVSAVSHD